MSGGVVCMAMNVGRPSVRHLFLWSTELVVAWIGGSEADFTRLARGLLRLILLEDDEYKVG